ncbi:hypothetical protein HZB60_06510 [candidate division KSB1 bacterium]|nr:hypothetical protein [candidate division KSB1 bacterium]
MHSMSCVDRWSRPLDRRAKKELLVTSPQRSFLDWLSERQVLQPEQLALVTQVCQEESQTPERVVIRLGLLSEADLIALYSDLYQLRFLKLEDVEIDPEATRHLPARIAHRYSMIPIRRSGNTLALVMADPLDKAALAAAKSVTDFELIPFAGRVDAIEHAVFLHYGESAQPEAADETSQPKVSTVLRSRLLGEDDRVGHMAKSIPLNPEWTWDKLVVCPANEHAVSLLRDPARTSMDGGSHFGLIRGAPGCGKSHLLHAVAQATSAQNPLGRLLLTTARRFADHLYESVRDGKLNLFRYLYRELDLLLLDELEWLDGREWVQRELAETLQALQKKRKSAYLMSREHSAISVSTIPALRALLDSGFSAEITAYPTDARLDILRGKCGNIELPAEVLQYLSRRTELNIGGMLDYLQPLVVLAAQNTDALTLDTAIELLGPLNRVTMDDRRCMALADWSTGVGLSQSKEG